MTAATEGGLPLHPPVRQHWFAAARAQVRVVSALVRRETLVHFGELRLGYLWALIEPCLHLLTYGLLFSYILRRTSPLGGSVVLFGFTGIITYFLYSKLASYLAGAIDGNRALLNLPPVKPIDVFIARAVLEASTYLVVALIMMSGLHFFMGVDTTPKRPLELVGMICAVVSFGFGIGLINAVVKAFILNWMMFFGFVSGPLFLLSGIFFLPSQVPLPYREYLLYNPLMHYIMWIRCVFYSNYDPSELDRGYAVWCSTIATIIGLMSLRLARRKLLEPI